MDFILNLYFESNTRLFSINALCKDGPHEGGFVNQDDRFEVLSVKHLTYSSVCPYCYRLLPLSLL